MVSDEIATPPPLDVELALYINVLFNSTLAESPIKFKKKVPPNLLDLLNPTLQAETRHEIFFCNEHNELEIVEDDEIISTSCGNQICRDAFDSYYFHCDNCSEINHQDDRYYFDNREDEYCQNCYDDNSSWCDDCETSYHSSDNCECDDNHEDDDHEDSNLNAWNTKNVIHKEFYLFETDKNAWAKKYLHPDFYKIIDNWKELSYTEPCGWVFEFPFVNELFCDHLIDEINNINAWSPGGNSEVKDKRINNVENVPTVDIHMSQIGFRKQWEQIIFTYISHVVSELYSPFKTNGLNIAFVVKYDMEGQIKLNRHHDASAYSLSITLNTPDVDFEGGGTRYVKQETTVRGKKGYAILHPGRLTHYHEGLPITSGTRYIMVSFVN